MKEAMKPDGLKYYAYVLMYVEDLLVASFKSMELITEAH
jgi:hypothetical protein